MAPRSRRSVNPDLVKPPPTEDAHFNALVAALDSTLALEAYINSKSTTGTEADLDRLEAEAAILHKAISVLKRRTRPMFRITFSLNDEQRYQVQRLWRAIEDEEQRVGHQASAAPPTDTEDPQGDIEKETDGGDQQMPDVKAIDFWENAGLASFAKAFDVVILKHDGSFTPDLDAVPDNWLPKNYAQPGEEDEGGKSAEEPSAPRNLHIESHAETNVIAIDSSGSETSSGFEAPEIEGLLRLKHLLGPRSRQSRSFVRERTPAFESEPSESGHTQSSEGPQSSEDAINESSVDEAD